MTLKCMFDTKQFGLDEPVDLEVPAYGSNTRTQTGTFRMQVRDIVCHVMWIPKLVGPRTVTLGVEGRRYKPDGTLGERRVYAPVGIYQLPEAIRDDIWEWLPKEITGHDGSA